MLEIYFDSIFNIAQISFSYVSLHSQLVYYSSGHFAVCEVLVSDGDGDDYEEHCRLGRDAV
jgi:hypothetical protein